MTYRTRRNHSDISYGWISDPALMLASCPVAVQSGQSRLPAGPNAAMCCLFRRYLLGLVYPAYVTVNALESPGTQDDHLVRAGVCCRLTMTATVPLPPRRSHSPTTGLPCTSVQHLPLEVFLLALIAPCHRSQWLIYWLLYSLISLAEAVLWPALK